MSLLESTFLPTCTIPDDSLLLMLTLILSFKSLNLSFFYVDKKPFMETIFSLYNVTYNVFFRELVNRLCPGIYIFFVIVFPLFHCFRHFNGKLHTDDVNIAIFFISVSKSTRTYIFFYFLKF